MLKYLTHKLRTQSINEDSQQQQQQQPSASSSSSASSSTSPSQRPPPPPPSGLAAAVAAAPAAAAAQFAGNLQPHHPQYHQQQQPQAVAAQQRHIQQYPQPARGQHSHQYGQQQQQQQQQILSRQQQNAARQANNAHEKIDGHDSGTESDGDLNADLNNRDEYRDHDMESNSSSRHTTITTSSSSPTDTLGSASGESPAFMGNSDLHYDPHSSEEELEVINGPAAAGNSSSNGNSSNSGSGQGSNGNGNQQRRCSRSRNGNRLALSVCSGRRLEGAEKSAATGHFRGRVEEDAGAAAAAADAADEDDEDGRARSSDRRTLDTDDNVFDSPQRSCSSTVIVENRKRSLAQCAEDDLRYLCDHGPAPINFRSTPPLEALKPHHAHTFSAAVLNHHQHHHQHLHLHHLHLHPYQPPATGADALGNLLAPAAATANLFQPPLPSQRAVTPLILAEAGRGIENIRITCDSPTPTATSTTTPTTTTTTVAANAGHQEPGQQPQQQQQQQLSSSPPTKFFHCAVSPRRRPPRQHRLHRSHQRPCLDFDKMQQQVRS